MPPEDPGRKHPKLSSAQAHVLLSQQIANARMDHNGFMRRGMLVIMALRRFLLLCLYNMIYPETCLSYTDITMR